MEKRSYLKSYIKPVNFKVYSERAILSHGSILNQIDVDVFENCLKSSIMAVFIFVFLIPTIAVSFTQPEYTKIF